MKQYGFSDDELRTAAASVRASMLSAVEAIPSGEREFSEGFLAKMDELFVADKRRRKRRLAWRHVAGLFLACLIGVSVWLAVDEGARAAFQRWVREVYENTVGYRFFGGPAETIPRYELTWIPEGFVLDREIDDTDEKIKQRDFVYEYPETGDAFNFCYVTMSEDISMYIGGYIGIPVTEAEPCTINGFPGEYYPTDTLGDNTLIWFDEKQGLVFAVDSTIDRETVFRIAESVTAVEDVRIVPPRYDVWWYPDGCGMDARVILDGEVHCTYGNYETKEGFLFHYRFMNSDWQTETGRYHGDDAPAPEHCAVNGMPAEYYMYDDGTCDLVWLDETQGIVLAVTDCNLGRDTVFRIARNVYLASTDGDLLRYDVRWIPAGFEMVEDRFIDTQDDYYGDETRVVRYVSGADEITFQYAELHAEIGKSLCYPKGVQDNEPYEINGLRGRYYSSEGDTRTNTFVWVNEDRGIVFSVSGTLEKDVLLRIARDIVLVNATR